MIKYATKLQVRRRNRKDKMPFRKLKNNTIKINRERDDLQVSLNEWLAEISPSTEEEKWNAFQSIVYKVFNEKLNTVIRKHENWFDGISMELEELINNRNLARTSSLLWPDIEDAVNFSDRDSENVKSDNNLRYIDVWLAPFSHFRLIIVHTIWNFKYVSTQPLQDMVQIWFLSGIQLFRIQCFHSRRLIAVF